MQRVLRNAAARVEHFMAKSPKDQLSGLVKRRSLVRKRLSAAAKGIKRNGSLKQEDWYERAQQRFAIAAVKEVPVLSQETTEN
jgi:L-fucose mutarotase/ribose pyranase (RbsD/FucU family)